MARKPPPTKAGIEAEWCGERNGRLFVSAPFSMTPATEAIIETSSSSAGDSVGRIVGSRAASIDLPEPGGPIISLFGTVARIVPVVYLWRYG